MMSRPQAYVHEITGQEQKENRKPFYKITAEISNTIDAEDDTIPLLEQELG
jgi:hypothetical protein